MNRELKFKVWDNVDYMSTPFSIKDIQDKKIQFTDECKVLQFTGLLDKNGTEIYEGDILRHPAKDEWEKINYTSFEVFFHDNDSADSHVGFQFNRLHFHGSIAGYSMHERFLPSYTKKMEIIGNIYEPAPGTINPNP